MIVNNGFGPVIVGVATRGDELGLDWFDVVASTQHGDRILQTVPAGPGWRNSADRYADLWIDTFEGLGLVAERGEPSHP